MIFRFMGVPRDDWPQLRAWGGNRLALGWGRPTAEEQVEHARNMAAYRGYLRGLVAPKTTDRDDDFASALLEIHDEDPEQLTHEEIASILFSLSFAGHETTNNLIGNAIRRLLEEPERWDAVVADPTLIPGVVDEVLRYDPSVIVWRRQAKRDVTVGGVAIPGGREALSLARRDGPRPVGLPRARTLRSAAGEREADTRVRQGHPLLHRRGPREARGSGGGRAAGGAVPPSRLVPGQEIPFHPNIAFRGPIELFVVAESSS